MNPFIKIQTPGDGDCFYHSIRYYIGHIIGNHKSTKVFKQEFCKYMRESEKVQTYFEFIKKEVGIQLLDGTKLLKFYTIDAYLTFIEKQGTWADSLLFKPLLMYLRDQNINKEPRLIIYNETRTKKKYELFSLSEVLGIEQNTAVNYAIEGAYVIHYNGSHFSAYPLNYNCDFFAENQFKQTQVKSMETFSEGKQVEQALKNSMETFNEGKQVEQALKNSMKSFQDDAQVREDIKSAELISMITLENDAHARKTMIEYEEKLSKLWKEECNYLSVKTVIEYGFTEDDGKNFYSKLSKEEKSSVGTNEVIKKWINWWYYVYESELSPITKAKINAIKKIIVFKHEDFIWEILPYVTENIDENDIKSAARILGWKIK